MGTATLTAQSVFSFRIDPEEIQWTYNLNTHTDDTYGGKVIQLLSVNIDDMTIPIVGGAGGRAYIQAIAAFFKDMMVWQRDTGRTAVFSYPPRGWQLNVYASNFKFEDSLQNIVFPFSLVFKVQEDLVGVVKQQIIMQEIQALQAGIGYTDNKFNDPGMSGSTTSTGLPTTAPVTSTPGGAKIS